MAASNVYFTDFHTTTSENQIQKLKRLILTAGMQKIDFRGKFVAIKMHFGEPGNLAFLRPNYARAVADVVKELGGKPFLTDCNTLYPGSRKNALEHIEAAYENGFFPLSTGCQVVIADGIKGTHFMCGHPERMIVVSLGDYLVVAFGHDGVNFPEGGKLISTFLAGLQTADANAQVLHDEAITG